MYKIHNKIITTLLKWDKQCYFGLAAMESQILRGIFKAYYQQGCQSFHSICFIFNEEASRR